MRHQRQMASAFVLAAILSSAMPLSANNGDALASSFSRCALVLGLGEMGLPSFAVSLLWGLFGCN